MGGHEKYADEIWRYMERDHKLFLPIRNTQVSTGRGRKRSISKPNRQRVSQRRRRVSMALDLRNIGLGQQLPRDPNPINPSCRKSKSRLLSVTERKRSSSSQRFLDIPVPLFGIKGAGIMR